MTRADIRAEERRWRRGDVLAVTAALIIGSAFAWIVLSIQGLTHELKTANGARDALASQVQRLGGKPVTGPPGSRGESITGPRGTKGEPGKPGDRGPSGTPGKDGADGEDGPKGGNGEDGVGEEGPTGASGVDGAAGPPGPQGEPGPSGPQGEQGPAGEDGTDGRDGQTCPDGYSLQPPADDPDALVCRRDGAPRPEDPDPTPQAAALDPQRRQY